MKCNRILGAEQLAQSKPKAWFFFHWLKNVVYFPLLVLRGINFTTGKHVFFPGGEKANVGFVGPRLRSAPFLLCFPQNAPSAWGGFATS